MIWAPDLAQQMMMGDDLARMLSEDVQHLELLRRQRERLALESNRTTGEIDLERAAFDDRIRRRAQRMPSQGHAGAGDELRHAERLGHVVVGAELEQADLFLLARAHRQD